MYGFESSLCNLASQCWARFSISDISEHQDQIILCIWELQVIRCSLWGLKQVWSHVGNRIAQEGWWICGATCQSWKWYVSICEKSVLAACLWDVCPSRLHCLAFHLAICGDFSTSTDIVFVVGSVISLQKAMLGVLTPSTSGYDLT